VKYQDCLSLMELLEIRDDRANADVGARAHLDQCARCRALLAELEDGGDAIQVELPTELPTLPARLQDIPQPETVSAGQVWLASAPAMPDWRYPVLVIGRPKQRPGTVLVAPVFPEIDQATDLDLLLPANILGYPTAVAVWNYGFVFEHQLDEYAGGVGPTELETVHALYRHIVAGGERPAAPVGLPLGGELDPRRVFRHELLERLRPAYEPVRTAEEAEGPELQTAGRAPTLSVVLGSALEQPDWDKQSLLERADIPAETLDMFLSDYLNLTYQHDIDALVKTLKVLELDLDQVHEPVMQSLLWHSRGGELRAGTGEYSVAARAESGASQEDVARDVYRGVGEVDESPEGRERAARAYWQALVERFEEE